MSQQPAAIDPTAIAALVDQGLGIRRMAVILGVSDKTVWVHAHDAGIMLKGGRPRRAGGNADSRDARRAARPPPKVDPAELARLIGLGLRVAELERALGVHRATLHRTARAAGLSLPKRATRTPDRAGWVVLIIEHGLSVPALAAATGLRRNYVRGLLVEHGLLETWWGRRGARFAEWTLGEDDG